MIAAAICYFVYQGKPFKKAKKGYSWSIVGLLVGLIAVAAFWASDYFGGRARGLSFTGPVREFFLAVFFGDSQTASSEQRRFRSSASRSPGARSTCWPYRSAHISAASS